MPTLFPAYTVAPEDLRLHQLKPATIEFTLHADMIPPPRSRLTVARWDGDEWQTVGGTVDRRRGVISTAISTLGRYGVTTAPTVSVEQDTSISSLTCQPRAFSPNRGESTAISFRLNREDNLTIKVYNEAGRLRRMLKEAEQFPPGRHVLWWDGRDDDNQLVVTNFYIVTIEGEGTAEKKVVIVQNN